MIPSLWIPVIRLFWSFWGLEGRQSRVLPGPISELGCCSTLQQSILGVMMKPMCHGYADSKDYPAGALSRVGCTSTAEASSATICGQFTKLGSFSFSITCRSPKNATP